MPLDSTPKRQDGSTATSEISCGHWPGFKSVILGPASGGASGIFGACAAAAAGLSAPSFFMNGMEGLGRCEQAATERPAAATSAKREALIIENPGQE